MKQIAIFQSDLNVGGIQKSLVNLLNSLDESREYEIDVYLNERTNFYNLEFSDKIHIKYLNKLPYINRFIYFNILKGIVKKYKSDKKYDIAIDFSSYRNECALGTINCDAKKKIMWIHNDMGIKKSEEFKYKILHHFFKEKFKYFDAFVAVSDGIIDSFRKESKMNNVPIYTMPNIINVNEITDKSKENHDLKLDENFTNIVSMGRLCHQKGFDLLLEDFQKALNKRKDLRLFILGDGPEKVNLEKQIKELQLGSYVKLLGNKRNPYKYLKSMDAFVLTSRYEGQGMVLWEAKALGLQVIIPKRLEKYNAGIHGVDNIVSALCEVQRKEKIYDDLNEYNQSSLSVFDSLI
ncbi:glycosyltransferase [Clostridium sp. UBA7503]|uniref:glycosyltransferase n=1 Tax=Clostridium sp. UBA7503 TaxID=1946377 RepID=UPI003217C866